MSQTPKECFHCKNAGFPNQLIIFAGKDANGWIMKNPDGTTHTHKVKQEEQPQVKLTPEQQRQADIAKAHLENIEASRLLTQSINRLAAALEARK